MYIIQTLSGDWELRNSSADMICQATVPGSVLSALLEHKRIPDPYWRCNEYEVRERMAEDYTYQRSFVVNEAALLADCGELVCEGLDTIASIYINEYLVTETNDMHRTYRFPVKQYLHKGKNQIKIQFHSPLQFVREADAASDIFYASTGCMRGNGALRKAHYMFGWDWGPQLPDMGIFRDIRIEFSNVARFEDVHIRQYHETDKSVRLVIGANVKRIGGESPLLLHIDLMDPAGQIHSTNRCFYGELNHEIIVKKPQLWWPNGLGPHPLYQVKVSLEDEAGYRYDQYECRIGLRTVTVSTGKNDYGNEFAITVNGCKIFAMGANYIPEDNLLSRVSQARTERLIADCAAANFNCLRVWGGGYYPDDYFYDKCDEEGILVWQDLMFGCNVYALNERFEDNIIQETKDNVRRLRHHACLALWCGNNEMEWGWGDEWARLKGHHPRYKADYTKIFEYILPRAIRACDDSTFYWPSSPSSGGGFDDPNAINRGDQHYWEVWHSGKPFTEYGDFSFCSEYGFQSFPHSKTIAAFTLPEDRNIFSRVMESHQKNGTANGKILNYIADYFLYPKDLDSLAYISQILQLKAIEYGVGHWRRQRGRCMGSLYWQLNDCWPVASWAGIDYYGRWKALHYGARRFYTPVAISIGEERELSPRLTYFLHNDTLENCCCQVEVQLLNNEFQVLWQQTGEYEVSPLSAFGCMAMDFSRWTDEEMQRNKIYSVFRLYEGGQLVAERTILFVKPKHFAYLKPEFDIKIRETEQVFEITVAASGFCQYVELYFKDYDPVFSDNFFDLTSPGGKVVTIPKEAVAEGISPEELKGNLVIRCVADSYCFDN